jgi:hypothetical protein
VQLGLPGTPNAKLTQVKIAAIKTRLLPNRSSIRCAVAIAKEKIPVMNLHSVANMIGAIAALVAAVCWLHSALVNVCPTRLIRLSKSLSDEGYS